LASRNNSANRLRSSSNENNHNNNETTSSSSSSGSSNHTDIEDNSKSRYRHHHHHHPMKAIKTLLMQDWKSSGDFVRAQGKVAIILLLAYIGNAWPHAYPRNDNHNMIMFWVMNAALLLAAAATLKHDVNTSSRGVQLLSRSQTEEWKGWMQWAFIMYHYYRAYSVYNEIRVFVSAYVWMTGFGNFLYFDKKQDFSVERAISMWLRINYFPLLLSVFLGVKLELYYVVPLHTAGFFITMATCYLAKKLGDVFTSWNADKRNAVAIAVCLLAHIVFYETPAVGFLELFSHEYSFRFQSDKYTAWVGILSGFFWGRFQQYMQYAFAKDSNEDHGSLHSYAPWIQRGTGLVLIALWYILFGHISDKFTYNPMHPYVFWMPVAGWLMVRNSSKYLTELHSTALEFFGRITLETYVLQFHLFMCRDVQFIPIVIPGSGPDGPLIVKTLNMLLCGVIFVSVAWWARKITVTTQNSVTELVHLIIHRPESVSSEDDKEQTLPLTANEKSLKAAKSDLEARDANEEGEDAVGETTNTTKEQQV